MKFKYFFALILILTVLFSLGAVVGNENINASSSQDTYLSIDAVGDQTSLDGEAGLCDGDLNELENQNTDLVKQDSSDSNDEVDLSVYMELGDIKKETYGINEVTFEVPLIITAKLSDGIAKNTKVYHTIPSDFKYLSYTANIGEYDPETGIWDIGDFDGSVDATLTILTQINTKGTFVISVNATTDSADKDLSNNNLNCNIQVSSKITSNTTRTSADIGVQHTPHQGSLTGGRRINLNSEASSGNEGGSDDGTSKKGDDSGPGGGSSENGGGQGSGGGSSGNGGSSNNGGSSSSNGGSSNSGSSNSGGERSSNSNNNALKVINLGIFDGSINAVGGTLNTMLNPNSNADDDSNSSVSVVKAISIEDYTQIPILVFGLFLVVLMGALALDKIKS